MLLEYAKVTFSWPPVIAVFLFWFVRRFSGQIADLIDKIKSVKLPGGSEVMISEKELQQEMAAPAGFDFPRTSEEDIGGKGQADLSSPAQKLEAQEGPSPNFAYSGRARKLYPTIDPDPVVKWMHENPGPAFEEYLDKVFQLHCERTFNMIFGTQVQVLEYLNSPTLTGTSPAATFVPFYDRHVLLTTRTERTLLDYLGFLVARGLVENVGPPEGPLYRISEAGRQFLQYIKQFYPLQWSSKVY